MQKHKKSKLRLLHQYYKYTGFYRFIWENTKKALLPILLFIAVLLFINYRVMSINDMLLYITNNLSDTLIFTVFLISESFLGLLPPDIFIAWTKNSESPLLYLTFLAFLSFSGGVFSYYFGRTLLLIPKINNYLEGRMTKHIQNMQKWGGLLIAVGALLPLPFAMACLAAGMIRFSERYFFLFASLRFLRFVIYGYAIYSALS
ncbi:YqaA family protein [Flavobacterium haoranii]|uniref:Membrane protein YqaA, SNARE-associated domain n=1 Tax=Flavobacterium haoranii TaxID=683124 RepID=A0A1M6HUD0_9FLAO|nr:short-chain dehydrogenase [Flavobacterium haoranii]SHJ25757.1 membrane protein YqaA, SNARE-associated domain [Flavobacterium haoranii]